MYLILWAYSTSSYSSNQKKYLLQNPRPLIIDKFQPQYI